MLTGMLSAKCQTHEQFRNVSACGRMSSDGRTQDYLPQRTSVKESEGASRIRSIVVLAFGGAVFSGCDNLRPAENRDPFNPALEIF